MSLGSKFVADKFMLPMIVSCLVLESNKAILIKLAYAFYLKIINHKMQEIFDHYAEKQPLSFSAQNASSVGQRKVLRTCKIDIKDS